LDRPAELSAWQQQDLYTDENLLLIVAIDASKLDLFGDEPSNFADNLPDFYDLFLSFERLKTVLTDWFRENLSILRLISESYILRLMDDN
jgi:hypothetical protein